MEARYYFRNIQEETVFTDPIWHHQQTFPQWYRDASAVFLPTIETFRAFWGRCDDIFGLFKEGEDLSACVYAEHVTPKALECHFSILKPVPEEMLIEFFSTLRNKKIEDGFEYITAWIFHKNRGVVRLAEASGFHITGLKMDYGVSKGKVARWIQLRAI